MTQNERYSRQIGTYGIETMKKLSEFKIFIYGMRGLGAELAKNIILMGVKEVTICDENLIKINDLSSNYILKEEQVGKMRRDKACLSNLKKLNYFVEVNCCEISDLTLLYDIIKNYEIVIITEIINISIINNIEKICRKNNHGFIYTAVLGLFSFIFDDFGKNHSVNNWNGNSPNSYFIKNISNEKECLITIDDTNDSQLPNEGDFLFFKEIEGMEELNDGKPRKIKYLKTKNSFTIEEDTSSYGKYIKNGICYEKKMVKKINFSTFENNLKSPVIDENIQCENTFTIHSLIYSIQNFYNKNNSLPILNNEEQSKIIYNTAKKFYEENKETFTKIIEEKENEYEDFNEELALNLSKFTPSEISPYVTFIGGIVSQEIVKFSGNYTPLNQWFYFEAYDTIKNLKNPNRHLLNSRYDDQIGIYGQEIQEKLSKINIFMVGAGALGCEYLKIFAMMGISTNKNSKTTITDNDNIELSNLNRQFLFNTDMIGKSKSESACLSIKKINKNFNCEAHTNLLGFETENIYNEKFYEIINILISAVDNNKARKYLDNQAILFKKPLLDAGTEGTKANSILVIPNLTESLSNLRAEKSSNKYTSCTLRSFPSLIEHCIEWAKVQFEKIFISDIQNIINLISDQDSQFRKIEELSFSEKLLFLNDLKENLILLNLNNYENCIKMAFKKFYYHFSYRIKKLLELNPDDLKNPDGTFFWSGTKRKPEIINFDINDELCREFIFSFANIISRCFSIEKKDDIDNQNLADINEKIKLKYIKDNDLEFEEENDETQKGENEENCEQCGQNNNKYEEKINNLKEEIKCLLKKLKLNQKINPEIFNKDDDTNNQIDFIYSFSNLRARNYKISECDKFKAKFIAGRIIPAIESTTATVTGFNSSQIFSILISNISKSKIENFNEIQLDLGTSFFSYHNPCPKKIKNSYAKNKKNYIAIPKGWSVWDMINIVGPMTLEKFLEFFLDKYQIKVRGIYTENMEYIYDKKLIKENLEDIYSKFKKKDKNNMRHLFVLYLDAIDDKKNIIILPPIVYKF